ncbi:hypothetical protein BCS37_08510 [Selenomonas sp. oral taxon 920]|uniref:hypothetical protein n=1 Tax=Selenomonas sp. oral taxon 920 TaxID=1884263 RepID=UPI000840D841|nr:hypothetical protein [Selenomonas sp. oral taxon 920]AOH48480.1 hypothetical protein BCS37_08510 [Selenomonas sp. oral taxon 920]
MLLIVRYVLHRRQRSDEADEDLAESIEKLKKELQQSADTIIKRLGSHVTKLEGLLREADDRCVRLETRVADGQRLEWALRQRIEELERRLRDLGQTPPAPPVMRSPEPVPPMVPVQEARRTDGDEFAAVLHQSILREHARAAAEPAAQSFVPPPPTARAAVQSEHPQTPAPVLQPVRSQSAAAMPAPPPRVPSPPQPPMMTEAEAEPAQEDEAIIKARALLRAGRTIEQVARETGVEIGALRLMKQMTQRD